MKVTVAGLNMQPKSAIIQTCLFSLHDSGIRRIARSADQLVKQPVYTALKVAVSVMDKLTTASMATIKVREILQIGSNSLEALGLLALVLSMLPHIDTLRVSVHRKGRKLCNRHTQRKVSSILLESKHAA